MPYRPPSTATSSESASERCQARAQTRKTRSESQGVFASWELKKYFKDCKVYPFFGFTLRNSVSRHHLGYYLYYYRSENSSLGSLVTPPSKSEQVARSVEPGARPGCESTLHSAESMKHEGCILCTMCSLLARCAKCGSATSSSTAVHL